MTMRITMTQTRMGESGSLLLAGTTYTVSDAFGAAMVGAKYATDTDNALTPAPSQLSIQQMASVQALVSKDGVLDAASAGASSPWFAYTAGMRLAYSLDSGATTTTFSIDFSADGVTSLGQAFTGTWASSTVAEITPPLYLTNPQARFLRFNVLTGGPLSVSRNI